MDPSERLLSVGSLIVYPAEGWACIFQSPNVFRDFYYLTGSPDCVR